MTIHRPGGLADNLSFDFSPAKPNEGPLGTEPGLWLADAGPSGPATNLLGGDANPPGDSAALSYYIGQQKPSSIALPLVTTSDSASSTTPPALTVTENYGFGLLQSGSAGLDFAVKGSSKPGGGHGGGGGGSLTPYTSPTVDGLKFVINWDSSVGSAPSGFQSAFENAVGYFLNNLGSGNLSSSLTVTIDVGYGEVAGQKLSPFALGESSTYINQVGYSQLYDWMSGEANASTGTPDQKAAVASLPNPSTSPNGPINGATYWLSTAAEKALNGTNNTSLDGSVGFSSGVSWDYVTGSTPSPGVYDFTGVAAHEISEVMGRLAFVGGTVGGVSNSYSNLDLFRYSGADTRSTSSGGTAYLSFDSGTDNLSNFNTNSSAGDLGDWAGTTLSNDAFNYAGNSGTLFAASAADAQTLNVLGYGLHGTPTLTPL